MGGVSDPGYLKEHREETKSRVEAWKRNAQFRASSTLSREDFGKHKLQQMAASRNFKAGEALFVHYGETSMF